MKWLWSCFLALDPWQKTGIILSILIVVGFVVMTATGHPICM